MSQVARDLPEPADSAGAGGAPEDLWRHPRPVHRLVATVRVRGVPARVQLPLPGRLRGQRKAVIGDHLSAARVQDQIPRKLFHAQRESRVRQHQQNLRFL